MSRPVCGRADLTLSIFTTVMGTEPAGGSDGTSDRAVPGGGRDVDVDRSESPSDVTTQVMATSAAQSATARTAHSPRRGRVGTPNHLLDTLGGQGEERRPITSTGTCPSWQTRTDAAASVGMEYVSSGSRVCRASPKGLKSTTWCAEGPRREHRKWMSWRQGQTVVEKGTPMSLPTRPFGRSMLPDFRDLFDMLPSLSSLRPAMDIHSIRIEDKLEGDTYIIRAELPGINVDEDLDISVQNNLLTIEAQRSEEQTENGRSEFRYGSFVRTVALPEGAQEDSIDASYED